MYAGMLQNATSPTTNYINIQVCWSLRVYHRIHFNNDVHDIAFWITLIWLCSSSKEKSFTTQWQQISRIRLSGSNWEGEKERGQKKRAASIGEYCLLAMNSCFCLLAFVRQKLRVGASLYIQSDRNVYLINLRNRKIEKNCKLSCSSKQGFIMWAC